MLEELEDRLGMTEEQWENFKRDTRGFPHQDENGVDLSLLRRNLSLTPTERLQSLQRSHDFFIEVDRGRRPV
jgi:hypothetical protein